MCCDGSAILGFMKIKRLSFSKSFNSLLRFCVAALLPPLLTYLFIGLFETLAKAGIQPYEMYSFSDQAFLSQIVFILTMGWGGILVSAVTGLVIFILCEKYWLPQLPNLSKRKTKKIKFKIITIGLFVYIAFILLMHAFLFLQPIFFVPVVIVTYSVTSLYLWLYKIHHHRISPTHKTHINA